MFYIVLWLLWALVLGWFGFDTVVQVGMKEIFDIAISNTTYFFIFGAMGMLNYLLYTLNPNFKGIEFKKQEAKVVLDKTKKTK